MKTKQEIEQLAESEYGTEIGTQCQEDIKSLLLEIKDSWKGDKLLGGTYEKICNLNKQD